MTTFSKKHEKTRENTRKDNYFLAPCSAFVTKVSKRTLSQEPARIALQGAGAGTRKTRENTEKHEKSVQESVHMGHV